MDTTTQWVLIAIFWIGFAIVAHYLKRRKDMRLMAEILKRREGREARWAEDLHLHGILGADSGMSEEDIINGHKETLASEEQFIEYFKEKYGRGTKAG